MISRIIEDIVADVPIMECDADLDDLNRDGEKQAERNVCQRIAESPPERAGSEAANIETHRRGMTVRRPS